MGRKYSKKRKRSKKASKRKSSMVGGRYWKNRYDNLYKKAVEYIGKVNVDNNNLKVENNNNKVKLDNISSLYSKCKIDVTGCPLTTPAIRAVQSCNNLCPLTEIKCSNAYPSTQAKCDISFPLTQDKCISNFPEVCKKGGKKRSYRKSVRKRRSKKYS